MKITAFYADWCGSCETILPKLEAYARRNGMMFEKVNVDHCTTDKCESIDAVPHVLVDGQPVSDRHLEQMIKDGS
jgi:thiol-disulfide isomerase/thioredoxin